MSYLTIRLTHKHYSNIVSESCYFFMNKKITSFLPSIGYEHERHMHMIKNY